VPPQFAQEIFRLSLDEDSLLPLTDNVEITGNTMAFPKDETTPWGSNGIRAYWQGEAASAVTTKPVLGLATLRLKKLMALVPVTDELLDDTNALSSYLPDKIATSIRWKSNESILFGSGSGVPVGCMNATTTVTVAKESGQATQTLQPQNLAKMIARLPPGSFSRAVWIVNNDVLPALCLLVAPPVGCRPHRTGRSWGARCLYLSTPTPSAHKAMCCWLTCLTTRPSPRPAACRPPPRCTCTSTPI
jgi:HK97 family phage major capsid protein